jgi:diaminopimelate epimerase
VRSDPLLKRQKKFDYVKGHMGGNEIVFLDGSQISPQRYIEVGMSVLRTPSVHGDQAGILLKPKSSGDVRVKIVDRTAQGFITMCGGLSQVLPRALAETELGKRFHLQKPIRKVDLETDLGIVRIIVRNTKSGMTAFTDMTKFVDECYGLGLSKIQVSGVSALKIGKFLVVDANEILKVHPDANFVSMNQQANDILVEMQRDFDSQHFIPKPNADYSLFDMYPEDPTHGRVLFPHSIPIGHIEPSCGTGTIAVAVGLAFSERVSGPKASLKFDSGDGPFLGGSETTRVNMSLENGRVTHAEFTHSKVEITSVGNVWIR